MDLSTIKRKLDAGQYKNPWEVSTDNCIKETVELVLECYCGSGKTMF